MPSYLVGSDNPVYFNATGTPCDIVLTTFVVEAAQGLDASPSSVSISVFSAEIVSNFTLLLSPADVTISGTNAGTVASLLENASASALDITVTSSQHDRGLDVAPAVYTIEGTGAHINANIIFLVDPMNVNISSNSAALISNYAEGALPSTTAIDGVSVFGQVDFLELLTASSVAIAGSADLVVDYIENAAPATIGIISLESLFDFYYDFEADPSEISIASVSADTIRDYIANHNPAAFTLGTGDAKLTYHKDVSQKIIIVMPDSVLKTIMQDNTIKPTMRDDTIVVTNQPV